MRSFWNWVICCWKPRPISPIVLRTGTRASVNDSSAVSEDLLPSLRSLRLTEKPGVDGREHDLRHAPVATLAGRPGEQAQPVRLGAVGDVQLRPVDHPVVAVAFRAGPDAGHVRAGVGLGHRDRGDQFAAQRRGQVALLQLLAAVAVQRRCGHVVLHGDRHRDAGAAHPAEFLAEDHRVGVVRALAAVGRAVLQAQQPGGAERLEQLVRGEDTGLFPLVGVRGDLALQHAPCRLPERLVVCGELHPHSVGCQAGRRRA